METETKVRAKDAWVALVTEPNFEYAAQTELQRFGLTPYLPQFRRMWTPPGAVKPLVRAHPLFPRYLFLPLAEARLRSLHYVRGLRRPKPILCDADGAFWQAHADEIFTVAAIENRGGFDERLGVGDAVKLRSGALAGLDLFLKRAEGRTVELFTPLFGGCRGTVRADSVQRAA